MLFPPLESIWFLIQQRTARTLYRSNCFSGNRFLRQDLCGMEVDQVDFPKLQKPTVLKKRLAECYTYSIHRASRLRQTSQTSQTIASNRNSLPTASVAGRNPALTIVDGWSRSGSTDAIRFIARG